MTMKKNQCITIVDYSLQMTVNTAVQNCALFMCSTLKKARFALQGHTHVFLAYQEQMSRISLQVKQ